MSYLLQFLVFIDNIISKAIIAICPKSCLIVSDPDQLSLLNAGLSINYILLKQPCCMEYI